MHWRYHAVAALIYLILALAVTWPLAKNLNSHVTPGEQSIVMVSQLNLWTLAWNHHWMRAPLQTAYWDSNNFYPHRYALAYSEPQFLTSLITLPLALVGVELVTLYNLVFLLFFFSSGWAVYLLAEHLLSQGGRSSRMETHAAAFLAGLLFLFNPYMFKELGVLQLYAFPFPPLTLLFMLRFMDRFLWRDAIMTGLCYLMCWNSCAYYGIFLTVFAMVFGIFCWKRWWNAKQALIRGGAVSACVLLLMWPLAQGMLAPKQSLSFERPKAVVETLSAMLGTYLRPPSNNWFYHDFLQWSGGSAETSCFVGGILLTFGILGAILLKRGLKHQRIDSPALAFGSGVERYFIWMALLAFILSLGLALAPTSPVGLGVYSIVYWLSPYNLLYEFFPGYSSIRSPYRFSIFLAMFLALTAGHAIKCLLNRVPWRSGRVLCFGAIGLLALIELWPSNVRLYDIRNDLAPNSKLYAFLAEQERGAVLELPNFQSRARPARDASYMLASVQHWQPLINGYSGFHPRAYAQLEAACQWEDSPERLEQAINAFSPSYIMVHWNEVSEKRAPIWKEAIGRSYAETLSEGDSILYQARKPERSALAQLSLTKADIFTNEDQPESLSLILGLSAADQMILSTPWDQPVELTINWYQASTELQSDPDVTSSYTYKNSVLIGERASVPFAVESPGYGTYRIEMILKIGKYRNQLKGLCTIRENGFVTFNQASKE